MEYDEEVLQQINQNTDLLAYAKINFDFKKRGDNYFTNCPLHEDKTPSLSINPKENKYYCFSCGRGGGIIGFLMDYEGLEFEDAVEKAAGIANVDLSKMCQSRTVKFLRTWKRALYPTTKNSEEHALLSPEVLDKYKHDEIREWEDEGISKDMLELFDIRLDDYGNRIVYPVYDLDGNLINIKGRTRYKNYKQLGLPKYINYYKVGIMDYFQGLNITLEHVKEKNEIIIFESIKSVMKAYEWGYKNCASAEKHTLTPEQIGLLIRLRVNVVFAYDSDVDYWHGEVKENIDRLRRVTNVYIIEDKEGLLGGKSAKNAPADCGLEIWETLYESKRKVV